MDERINLNTGNSQNFNFNSSNNQDKISDEKENINKTK